MAQIAQRLDVAEDQIDVWEPFTSYGLASRDAVLLTGDLELWLGESLSPTLAYDYPTVDALARYLAGEHDRNADAPDGLDGTSAAEPIAIIGLGCRFPGASDPDSYWRLLRDGIDAIREVPPDRWDVDQFYHSDPGTPGRMSTRWGGFLDDVDLFDASFFGISPREAASLDPQQRLLLEVTWEALENAGQASDRLARTQAGVFVGISSMDYSQLQAQSPDYPFDVDTYVSTGNAHSLAANRISYALDLRGPSVALDTACSSSLVALHLACRSLRDHESDLALAAGVNLILEPSVTISFSHAHMMALDGRCKTFDARGDGYVRGEGAGVVVLKRLSDALQDGDVVYAVVRGSAVNQDGRTAGITAPSGLAQQAVVRAAAKQAGIAPRQLGYVEAHGTGTALGDPIEMNALAAVLGPPTVGSEPCWVSSVKTNIGHLEAAAGIAGVIKVVLSLTHEIIPPHLHLQQLNPRIALEGTRLAIPTEPQPWPRGDRTRFAGVSSFGFGGTNAHIVIEEPPEQLPSVDEVAGTFHMLTLSAKTESSLKLLVRDMVNALAQRPGVSLADLCFSANIGRARFNHRVAAVSQATDELATSFAAFAAGSPTPGIRYGEVVKGKRPRIAFLFTGQGSQYEQMGAKLYRSEPVFRTTLDRCAEIFHLYQRESLLSVLFPEGHLASPLDQTAYTQPALFALEYALAALWRSWGVEPDLLVGHSVGEYVAACVARVFSLKDGFGLVCERGRLMGALPANGKMAVVFGPQTSVADVLAPYPSELSIAAVNGPATTVISGSAATVGQALERLQAEGISSRILNVSHAFHSPLMQPTLDRFLAAAETVSFTAPQIPIVSNVTGRFFSDGEVPDAPYWTRHISSAVQFQRSVEALAERGCEAYLEVGPQPTLLRLARSSLGDENALWLPSLRKGKDERRCILGSAAELFVHGVDVDCSAPERRKISLPTSPFERTRHWLRPANRSPNRQHPVDPAVTPARHPLLGRRLRSALVMQQWESQLSREALPSIGDHQVGGSTILPTTAYLSMALEATQEAFGTEHGCVIEDLAIRQALIVPDTDRRVVQLVLFPASAGETEFQILSQGQASDAEDEWTLHASGRARLDPLRRDAQPLAVLEDLRASCHEPLAGDSFYTRLRERGLAYGPAFRTVKEVWYATGQAVGRVAVSQPSASDLEACAINPALLDGCLQLMAAALPEADGAPRATYLPSAIEHFRLYDRLPDRVWSHATVRRELAADGGTITGDVCVIDESGRVVAEALGLRLTRLGLPGLPERPPEPGEPSLYEPVWLPSPAVTHHPSGSPSRADAPASWLIFADAGGVGAALAEQLTASGDVCITVGRGTAYDAANAGSVRLDPVDPEHLARLVNAVMVPGRPPLRGVVHLWALDTTATLAATSASAIQAAQEVGVRNIVLLVQALGRLAPAALPRLWLVTRGIQAVVGVDAATSVIQSPIWGLGRTLRWEHPELDCRQIDLDLAAPAGEVASLLVELGSDDREDEIALRHGARYVRRLRHFKKDSATGAADPSATERLSVPARSPYRLEVTKPGRLSNLRLRPTGRRQPGVGEVEIQVQAAGVNFRDVMSTLGVYPGVPIPLGAECAGRVVGVGSGVEHIRTGDEVMAVAPASLGTFATTAAELVAPKPSHLSFEEAATIPIAFLTAQYTLHHLARLERGERLLIHSAAGGVGLAALQLAQLAGAEVFATAGTPEKRAYLRDLGVQHVMDSRSFAFADDVLRLTSGRGVDVVLNALPGEYVSKSLSVLAPYGRFLEIGRTDIYLNRPLPLYPFRSNLSYAALDLDRVCRERPTLVRTLLQDLLARFQRGELRPLRRHVLKIEEAVAGFRHLAQRRNIGKVVLTLGGRADEPSVGEAIPLRVDGAYLVTGGLGALGLAVATWLVERGARHIALVGRSGPSDSARRDVEALRRLGAEIMVLSADVALEGDVRRTLATIGREMPALRGVVHAAGVIDDAPLRTLEPTQLSAVLAPKVQGAWHLHAATLDARLDFFVLFSSLASVVGSPGQGHYAAGNAFLDALAWSRRADGLPALAINWGPWAGVGMAAQGGAGRLLDGHGIGEIDPQRGLEALEKLLDHPPPQALVARVDWQRLAGLRRGGSPPSLVADLVADDTGLSQRGSPAKDSQPRLDELLLAANPGEREPLVISHLQRELGAVLGLDPGAVDPEESLNNVGLDSLMALELKEALESNVGIKLPMEVLLEDPCIVDLADVVLAQLPAPEAASHAVPAGEESSVREPSR